MTNKILKYIDRGLTWIVADNDRVENALSFVTGDIATMVVTYQLFVDVGLPIFVAILTGFLGGAFAILGKMFVKWIFKPKKKKNK